MAAGAVDLLAEAADGYRTLDGWLARLALAARVERRPIDRALAASVVLDGAAADQGLCSASTITIEQVAKAVAARFGVTLRDLRSPSRRKTLAEPRHLAMYLARGLTGRSFLTIGAYFGGRDPATVRHACRAAEARLAADPALAAAAEALCQPWRRASGMADG
jgi:chromosomal replication initiator protein